MYEIKYDRKPRRRIKLKRTPLLALVVCVMLVGTVAAIIYSNTLETTGTLTSEYPMELEWGNAGPFPAEAFTNIRYTDDIVVTNLDSNNAVNYRIFCTITAPVGCVLANLEVWIRDVQMPGTDNGDGTFSFNEGTPTALAAGASEPITFEFYWRTGAPLGAYDFDIYVWA